MSYLWVAPAVVAFAGLPVILGLARRASEEAAGLRRDLHRFAELQPALVEVRDQTAAAAAAAHRLHR